MRPEKGHLNSSLVFPVTKEQPANAGRVIFHKIGVAANIKTATAESLRSLLAQVESYSGFKDRAVAMMEAFHKAEREERAVTLIEQCLAGKLPVPQEVEREDRRVMSVAQKVGWFKPERETTAKSEFSEPSSHLSAHEVDLRKPGV